MSSLLLRKNKTMIEDLLKNKTAKEKANIKGLEIAKEDFSGVYESSQYGVKIEIIGDVTAIEGGIQVFAKAWRGNKQLGFGKDGAVEIERFLIYNPPVLVSDPNGDIIREWTDEDTGELKQRKLRADPKEAIRRVIAHNVTSVGKINSNIIKDKVGNTTSTFFSAAGASSPVDGRLTSFKDDTWSSHRNGSGTGANVTFTSFSLGELSAKTGGIFSLMRRAMFLFDTEPIPDADVINSATLCFYAYVINNPTSFGELSVSIVSASPASDDNLVTTDYEIANFGSTKFITDKAFSTFILAEYNDLTLNESGKESISKTGLSKFGALTSAEVEDIEPPFSAGVTSRILVRSADQTGTDEDPKLIVVHGKEVAQGNFFAVL